MAKAWEFVLALALALAGCASAPLQQQPGWESADAAAGARHEGGYDILDVTLALTPDPATRTIQAEQAMTVRPEQVLTALRFDANVLTIAEATLDGDPMTWRTEDRALIFTLPHALQPGAVATLRFAYAGAPARGLVWEENGLYTSYFTCDWMICALDRPGDAFTFAVDWNVERFGWQSFAAERIRAYPAHVQGFAAGRWTVVRETQGRRALVFASGHASEAELRAMFADAGAMQSFFERRARTMFPNAIYTQLLVQGDAAQEGAGFSILGDDAVRPVLADPHEDWAAAHEMAHQYWGNLISPKDWSHFWLSEGLTTFMVAAWKQERWGEADYQREIELATTRWTRARDAGWDRALSFAGPYPDLGSRRAIQYSKGMLFFVELRRVLGEDAFWRGIATYTRAHAGGTVESADMQRAMEEASGRDLGALFDAWVYP